MDEPVILQTYAGAPDVRIEASINPIDGSLEINRVQAGDVTDGIRLPMSALLLLEPMLTKHIARKMKELGRTRAALRSWAKRLHAS